MSSDKQVLILRIYPVAMASFIRLLTATAVLVHATVGCCAHEAHSVHGECSESICCHDIDNHGHSVEGELQAGCSTTLALISDNEHKSEQPVPHDCCRDKCKWTDSEARDNFDFVLSGFTGNAACSLIASHGLPQVNRSALILLSRNSSLCTAPVRAHLAKCVLLI
jgi:hypothetical protein